MAGFLAAVLPGILLPLLVSAALWAFVSRGGDEERRPRVWLGALGFGLAYLAAHVAINGRPELAPAESSQWLFHLVALATVIGALEAGVGLRWPTRLVLRAIVVAALLWLTLRPLVRHSWSAPESALALSSLAVAVLVLLFSADALGRRGPAALETAVWMASAGAGGVVLTIAGSARLGQMSGALAMALLPAAVLLWWRRDDRLAPGVALPALVAFAGVWLNGAFYTEMPPAASLAVAAAPFAAWIGEAPWIEARARRKLLAVALAVAVLLLSALGGALAESISAAEEDPYYY